MHVIINCRNLILNKYLHIFIIIFFQFFGTMLFSYWNLNLIHRKDTTTSQVQKVIYYFIDFSLSMFCCISYGRQFSGGLYNPSVAMFRLFRRTQRYKVSIGLLYMVIQISGGMTGSFIAHYVDDVRNAPITVELPAGVQAEYFFTQVIGTLILTFMVQYITEKKMTFIEHNREFYLCIPAFFLIARTYSSRSNSVNPALGFSFEVVWCIGQGRWSVLPMSYILVVGPLTGAFLAAMLFEYGFRPLFPIKKEQLIMRMKEEQLKKSQRQGSAPIQMAPVEAVNHRWTMLSIMNAQNSELVRLEPHYDLINQSDLDDQIDSIKDQNQKQDNCSQINTLDRPGIQSY